MTPQLFRSILFVLAFAVWVAPANAQSSIPSEAAIERQFLAALQDIETGQPREAIAPLLAIISIDPTLVRVRLELARAYFLAEQWERAREQFFIVLSGDVPDPVRQRVLVFIRAIDARRSIDWDIDISLVRAGNGRDYDTNDVTLDFGGVLLPSTIDRDPATDTAVQLITSVVLRRPLKLDFGELGAPSAFAQLDVNAIDAPSSELDDATVGLRAGLRAVNANTTTVVAPAFSRRYLAGEHYEDSFGLTLSQERRFRTGVFVFGSITQTVIENEQRDDLGGHQTQLFLAISRSIAGRSSIGTSLTFTDKSVEFDLDNAFTSRLRLFGSHEGGNGFVFKPAVFAETRHFKTPSPLFTEDPDERTLGAELRVEKSDLFLFDGFTPYAVVEFQRTSSGVEAYSFRESELKFGFERRF